MSSQSDVNTNMSTCHELHTAVTREVPAVGCTDPAVVGRGAAGVDARHLAERVLSSGAAY